MSRMAIGADEKKKLIVLGGLLGAIAIVVTVLYVLPNMGKGDTEVSDTPVAETPDKAGGPPGGPGKAADAGGEAAPGGGGGTGGSGATGITAASLVSVSAFRSDPFEPVPLPPPLPTPVPPPPPPPPVSIDPPMAILEPPGSMSIPPFAPRGQSTQILAGLPPVHISRVATAPTAPSVLTPPGGSGIGTVSRSPNKRLSGVIIGDSVRAVLEISDGENLVSRIVQPGDEVDGIRILRIERITEGGRPVTRMFIREGGEERFVDLRPAPQQVGEGAAGGAPGGGRLPF